MKSAVIYARVSTARQAAEELSVPAQIEHSQKRATELDAQVLRVFKDEGASAFYSRRPGFDDAVLYCELHQVDYFIVWSPSRFSRNKIDAGAYKRRLEQAGTRLVYCSMRIDTETTEGFVLDTVMEMMAELQSRETRADTLRSMIRNAQAGYWSGGTPPYGYAVENAPDNPKRRRLVVKHEEADITRRIFELAAGGLGAGGITHTLNGDGLTNRGRRWNKTVIGYLLRNETVIGRIVFGRTDRRTGRKRPREDWIVVESHQPIIDANLWARVQDRLTAAAPGAQAVTAHNSAWRFSGLVYCGECGAAMHVEQATGRSRRYPYFVCSEAKRQRAHSPQRIRADQLEEWLIDSICDRIFTRDFLEGVLREMAAWSSEWQDDRRRRREAIEKDIRDYERRNDKLFGLLEAFGRDTPNLGDLTKRLRANNAELERLTQQLADIEDEAPPDVPDLQGGVEELAGLAREVLRTADDPAAVRQFLSAWISRVELHTDHIQVVYHPDRIVGASGSVHSVPVWLPGTGAPRTKTLVLAPPTWWPLAA